MGHFECRSSRTCGHTHAHTHIHMHTRTLKSPEDGGMRKFQHKCGRPGTTEARSLLGRDKPRAAPEPDRGEVTEQTLRNVGAAVAVRDRPALSVMFSS